MKAVAGLDQRTSSARICVSLGRSDVSMRLIHRYIFRHPAEPQCSYDPVEGLTLAPETDPMEKIRLLEEQISMWWPFY